jgi:hypothetical protein
MPAGHAYCTVFDRNYALRSLVLYRSLERADDEFRLFAICMDHESKAMLDRLDLPALVTVGIDELERRDAALARVRASRTAVEYAWTAVPSVCRFVLERAADAETVTYLDADLCFFSSPRPIFDELRDGSILVVPHRSDPRDELVQGRFNVGWVTVRRDANGAAALAWWRERCLEWCHARVEPGRFGDQKYLDEWPRRFEGVRVCSNPAAGLGPFNQAGRSFTAGERGTPCVDGRPVVFFHHSGLTLHPAEGRLAAAAARTSAYRRTGPFLWTIRARHGESPLDVVWAPYVERCAEAHTELVAAGAPALLGMRPLTARTAVAAVARELAPEPVRDVHLALYRRLRVRRATPRRGSRGGPPR